MHRQAIHGVPRSGSRSHPHGSSKRSTSSSDWFKVSRLQVARRHSMSYSSQPEKIGRTNSDSKGWFGGCCDQRSNNSATGMNATLMSDLRNCLRFPGWLRDPPQLRRMGVHRRAVDHDGKRKGGFYDYTRFRTSNNAHYLATAP